MKKFVFLLLTTCLCVSASEIALQSLHNSLDPLSISQHLAFYELYPESEEGIKALKEAWQLLTNNKESDMQQSLTLPHFDIQSIISLVTRQSFEESVLLSDEQLQQIESLGKELANRSLKGASIWSKEELLALPNEEIDLARGLLLNQFEPSDSMRNQIRQYEASLDLMALQIRARLQKNATATEKIRAINTFIFQEMGFRFPPHSLYARDIDLYTFLPSVLDSRQGVCLGVSILYLSLAQRLSLPLEIITPPGHIYVRYHDDKEIINIETTARGVNPPSDTYLGINTRKLEMRTLKEVIGFAFVNQASVAWGKEDYKTTVSLYEKAFPYLPNDSLVKMLLGLNYLFIGKKREGRELLNQVRGLTFDYAVSKETLPEDYLKGFVDEEGLKAIFTPVDETRASIVAKQKQLQRILKRHPLFRAGLMQLATTFLQLGRGSEALELLEKYYRIDPQDATVSYYLTILCMERLDYGRSWEFLKHAEAITAKREHNPKALKSLRNQLKRVAPEPL